MGKNKAKMTTAHRPTYTAARGHNDQGMSKFIGKSQQISALDAPHHLTMKTRGVGQNKPDEVKRRDLKRELIEKESKTGKGKADAVKKDLEAIAGGDISRDEKKDFSHLDKDDTESDDDSVSGEDDSDEETAELMRELEKIKKERALETEREDKLADEKAKADAIRKGNPLINNAEEVEAGAIKRRWDDDVVFKNQARGEPELKKKRFINDTIRNDFHRRFMTKYCR